MSDLVSSLNPMQRAAVELPPQNALILAGAGSGKTRVLTTRIAWLIAQGYANPYEILAVTFTNKAAKEMKARLEVMLSVDVSRMWVGTFHGIAHKFLRLHAADAGLPKTFQIIDQSDQLSLIKRLMKDAGLNSEKNEPKSVQAMINDLKERGLRASAIQAGDAPGTLAGFYRFYEQRCQRDGLVDFAELLLRSVELFENNSIIRDHYSERFRFLLVDEFQDTNALQYRWIKALASPTAGKNTVFCVGDDDQSIYAFRGARVGNMQDFVKDYGVRSIVKLEQNYRSTSHILDAANAVIANNPDRLGKNLWTDQGAGDRIRIYEAEDDRQEARSLTQEILIARRDGAKWGDFAVLYRNNAQSRVIEQYLTANSVPYRIYGGLRFFDRQEVKDVTAYLRTLVSPDDTSVLRVINHPPRGIGATSVARITDAAKDRALSIWETISDWNDPNVSIGRVKGFLDCIEAMREACAGMNLAQTVRTVVEMSGLKAYYEAQKDKDIRLENLSEIESAAQGYYTENGLDEDADAFAVIEGGEMSPIEGFLAQAVLEADDKNEGDAQDRVQLMTVHASKGLEFPVVFLCGLEQGLFPHAPRPGEDAAKAESEERRLMYVAMTRAKRKLRISWCGQRQLWGDIKWGEPSMFLAEIPEKDWVAAKPKKAPESASRSSSWRSSPHSGSFSSGSGRGFSGASQSGWGSRGSSGGTAGWRQGAVGKASDFLKETGGRGAPTRVGKTLGESTLWGLKPGDRVTHKKFGEGTVLSIANPESRDVAQATVRFKVGVKELLLVFANLQKIS
ncbi:MAG: UvrD-helicase domain-containing protein [Duodenibacillus sp.]|nr:UvrD-helicase domain-containing protein [Duodenibacillus sp.]